MGYELAEQCGFGENGGRMPDVILYPTGGGVRKLPKV